MKKLWKITVLSLTVMASMSLLSMLGPLVQASSWQVGLPAPLKQERPWITGYYKTKNAVVNGPNYYYRYLTMLSQTQGVNINGKYYNKDHQAMLTDQNFGTYVGINPHYKQIGKHDYLVVSGDADLQYELHPKGTHFGVMNEIQVKNNHQILIWSYDRPFVKATRRYLGKFTSSTSKKVNQKTYRQFFGDQG